VDQLVKQLEFKPKEGVLKQRFNPEIYEQLSKPTFDIWAYTEEDYIHFMATMLQKLGLVDHFSIEEPLLMNFLLTVQKCYSSNPFHNFKHAFCVTQMMYSILHMGLIEKLSMVEKFSMILAAIGHDMDHPGLNNAYQINALTELAITYNDSSPLENHHCGINR
jgi:high affinity cGMP-specific 3',5'-cyclic phosphodiesterase 9